MEGTNNKRPKNTLILRLLPGFFVLAAMISAMFLRDRLFMRARYDLKTVSGVSYGDDGSIVVIDEGRSRVKILDKDLRLVKEYKGESEEGFYYADQAVLCGDTLYIADTKYDENDKEKIEKRLLTIKGKDVNVLFERKYSLSDADSSNEILDLQVKDGDIYFLFSVDYGLESYVIKKDVAWAELLERYFVGDKINDASIDLESGIVAIAVKRGYLRAYYPVSAKWNNL